MRKGALSRWPRFFFHEENETSTHSFYYASLPPSRLLLPHHSFFPPPLLPFSPAVPSCCPGDAGRSSVLVKAVTTQCVDGWFSNDLLWMDILAKIHLLSFKAIRSVWTFFRLSRMLFSVIGYRCSCLQALYQPFKKWICTSKDISFNKLLFSYSLKKERKEVTGKPGSFMCHWCQRAGATQIKLILYVGC